MKLQQITEVVFSVTSRRAGAFDLLTDVLIAHGVAPENLVEYAQGQTRKLSVYFSEPAKVEGFLARFDKLKLQGVRYRAKTLQFADWLEAWKKNIKPCALTKKFDVVPVWAEDKYRQQPREGRRTPIYLDTTMAFGTGLHETTRFMTEFIEKYQGKFVSCLDVGTGSGILALIAFHCGAKHVDAVDIDPECLKTARQNLARNGFRFNQLNCADFRGFSRQKKYDFVAANLFTQDLIALRQKLVSCVNSGKFLAISGIALSNLPLLRKSFRGLPLRCMRIKKGKKWAAILFQKTS